MNRGSSLRGEIAPDIMLMPYIRTANPIMMPPIFLWEAFFANIHRMIPIRATTPVSISVLKKDATFDPPILLSARIHPVILVPRIAPRMTPIACLTLIIPELTKPTTMTDVADDD